MTDLPNTLRHLPAAPITATGRLGYRVEGIAFIHAKPWRPFHEAHELAERIARDPVGYLAACAENAVPGVADLRGLLPAPGPDSRSAA